jgi:mRNA-degrading endonuclease toxin of MazEF toxin-antitoxin module
VSAAIRFGQVWVSRDEVMGSVNYLVVSSDAYNAAFGDRRVIAVEVDSRAVYDGTYREPVVDAGTAMLDRLVWVARAALQEQVADLHPDRHAAVAAQIRELIGN